MGRSIVRISPDALLDTLGAFKLVGARAVRITGSYSFDRDVALMVEGEIVPDAAWSTCLIARDQHPRGAGLSDVGRIQIEFRPIEVGQ